MISRYMVLVASEQKLLMMRPYQIYAVKNIVKCIDENSGNGYVWHTTGSGKTLTSFKASTLLKANRAKLNAYKPKFGFALNFFKDNSEKGIESVSFFIPNQNPDLPQQPIKISRGEERMFVWCFFLALFEAEGWADKQPNHFFIDDPVSSLDDHNIFVTAATLFDLIEDQFEKRRVIVTTHHIGLFSILSDWLTRGEKSSTFKKRTKPYVLSLKTGELAFEKCTDDVFLYHLRVLQVLTKVHVSKDVRAYHFAMLRQVLENVALFLGVSQFSYVLNQIGIAEPNRVADIVSALSHKRVYYYESDMVVEDNLKVFDEVMNGLIAKYNFVLHSPAEPA